MPIFYSAILLTGVNLLLRFASTTFQVFLSGRIGAAGIGLLQLVLSVGMLSMTVGMAGIRTATMYLTAEELGKKRPENIRSVLSGCFLYSILCSGTVSVGLYTFAPVIAERWIGDMQTVAAIRLLAGFLPVTCLCGVMTGYFTAANRIGTLAAVEVFEQILSMTVTMSLISFWAGKEPSKACCSVVLGSGIGSCLTVVSLIFLRERETKGPGRLIRVRRRLLQAAVPLAIADDLKSGISTTENLMVPKRLALYPNAENPLALFGTVCGMVFPVLMFPAAILFGLAELLIPELARCSAAGSRVRVEYLARRSLKVSMLYGCLFGGMMFLMAAPLCKRLYDSTEAGNQLKLYAMLCPMLYCDAITDAMTKGLGQQTACVRYNILTSTMDVVFLYLLLPRYGMAGYFVSFLVTHLLNFALSLRRLICIANLSVNWSVPIRCAIALLLGLWASNFAFSTILQTVGFVIIFITLLFLLNVLSKEDIFWLKSLVKGAKKG